MKKSDKKREQLILSTLHALCENALDSQAQFRWLTHHVDYRHFPASLEVYLIFDDEQSAATASADLRQQVQNALSEQSINLPLSRVYAMAEDAYRARFRAH
ncbi:MAG: hypothetical protein R3221_03850 [Spongiibacter sp.]|nr:hypothetical protein [Spongiibacter sp.]